jgi:hypothetical protein
MGGIGQYWSILVNSSQSASGLDVVLWLVYIEWRQYQLIQVDISIFGSISIRKTFTFFTFASSSRAQRSEVDKVRQYTVSMPPPIAWYLLCHYFSVREGEGCVSGFALSWTSSSF